MPHYANLSGNSGVASYEIESDSIAVTFRSGATYLYNYDAPGRDDVERMKELAEAGQGLSTYISQNVKKNFAQKLQ